MTVPQRLGHTPINLISQPSTYSHELYFLLDSTDHNIFYWILSYRSYTGPNVASGGMFQFGEKAWGCTFLLSFYCLQVRDPLCAQRIVEAIVSGMKTHIYVRFMFLVVNCSESVTLPCSSLSPFSFVLKLLLPSSLHPSIPLFPSTAAPPSRRFSLLSPASHLSSLSPPSLPPVITYSYSLP